MELSKAVSGHTEEYQEAFAKRLPASRPAEAVLARRGLIASRDEVIPLDDPAAMGGIAWDTGRMAFVQGDAPDTVNPSLWQQAELNHLHGLYEVMDGVWQVRGYDTSNVTFVATDTGWFVIDPLTTTETGRAAKRLVDEHLGERPVHAVVYTHSHVDHFGGILGFVSKEQIEAGDCAVIAPLGFLHAAVEENVVAQTAMGRRATWQYGMLLPWDVTGHVDQGLSSGVPYGTSALVAPTVTITETGQEMVVDGLRVEFQLALDTEAPAEMHLFFPDLAALCPAENCACTMHNVLTLRGALIRDSLAWTRALDEAIDLYGDRTEVMFAPHGWPRWGRDAVISHLRNHRDLYRWTHDEAMRHANLGCTPDEIADQVELPPGLWDDATCHGYYGTLSHNVRAVYQRYFGYYDGHPASLSPLPPVDAAHRYVRYMGGMEQLLANAERSYREGDYRFVVQVLRHAVFADPANTVARNLQADACEQLGYQAESGPWRDVYLTAALELRTGTPKIERDMRPSPEVASGMTPTQVFDYLSVRLDGPAALELGNHTLRWELTDTGEVIHIELSNGKLHSRLERAATARPAETVVRSTRRDLDRAISTDFDLGAAIDDGTYEVKGDLDILPAIWARLSPFRMFFAIIEP